jgi:hypothetical protein
MLVIKSYAMSFGDGIVNWINCLSTAKLAPDSIDFSKMCLAMVSRIPNFWLPWWALVQG